MLLSASQHAPASDETANTASIGTPNRMIANIAAMVRAAAGTLIEVQTGISALIP